ncbi:hypothetical protein ACAX43_12525 [Paraburkholderia sp. IW21]|uniref:hypothetical protein n=1 Tax=Paraburkholderia sp. IW21 TaxID=3242488 RepID=UPI00351FE7F3
MDDLTTLAANLNSLTTYPSIADMHALATELQQYNKDDVTQKLLPALTNSLLVTDIKRLIAGALPSTISAPIFVQPTNPTDPKYPTPTSTVDAGAATGTEPQIKPAA